MEKGERAHVACHMRHLRRRKGEGSRRCLGVSGDGTGAWAPVRRRSSKGVAEWADCRLTD